MTLLRIFSDQDGATLLDEYRDAEAIAAALAKVGVRFEQWQTQSPLPQAAEPEAILTAYAKDIDRLKQESGYITADVIRMHPDHPQKTELRQKFLAEHIHKEDEVRFFVEGQAVFYLHLGNKIYATLCTAGDLIGVPANTPHWFDMGDAPQFAAIRLFCNQEGWVAHFTDSPIAKGFPDYHAFA
ncbi:cupin domain-containing protein [Nodosilinea sp. LEGE 07298]|uniref:1,2-dihydroxy-3-keto-5-methylthiopentene dioxygenase n=1 Tax=Nodosilinea sp. LEGE 07298 TaxID=2777970 RepID=UPI00187E6050|nr:cupin domain-containing protein [Nodosilinea sp. LEGE 07298]MBE9112516.1 cupin domain-containing protein [Nodosilinea sp. LEGE 07298]